MSIVLMGTTSGSLTLQEPAVAGSNTLNLPAATGTVMVSGNMPAFSATKITTNQTITDNVTTKVTFNSEDFDTNNNFASSTFTPTVEGYYIVTASAFINYSNSTGANSIVNLYKNGSSYAVSSLNTTGSNVNAYRATVSAVIYMNGTTDYLEVYALGSSGTATITVQANASTRFTACLVRGA